MENIEIEKLIEEQGVESAVSLVIEAMTEAPSSEREEMATRLDQACGTRIGGDTTKWKSWLDDRRSDGAIGFGPLPSSQIRLPADAGTMEEMLKETILDMGKTVADGDATPKRMFGNFEIIDKIGEGGMGAVFSARQVTMDRIVALKILPEKLAENEEFIARFLREARIAAKLDHVNIVRGIEVGEQDGTYYFAMELVLGGSISAALKKQSPMSEERALHVAIQVTRALDHAWGLKLIHRDIKPDNILLTEDDVAKLADLGLARSTVAEATMMTQTGVAMGTPHYMSPEQARGDKDIDIRTDIYSLGATLYHMVTGQTPFTGSSVAVILTKHLTESPVPAHIRCSQVSVSLSTVISKMMARKMQDRYTDPSELMEDLELVADGKEPANATATAQIFVTDATGAVSLLGVEDIARLSGLNMKKAEPSRTWWVLPASIGASAIVLLVAILLLRGGNQDLDISARRELAAARVAFLGGRFEDALSRAEVGAELYADSQFGKELVALADKARDEIENARKEEAKARKVAEAKAAFAAAVDKADAAERDGRLGDAVASLDAALAVRDDEELRKRHVTLTKTIEVRARQARVAALLKEARKLREAGALGEARAKLEDALRLSPADEREATLSILADVDKALDHKRRLTEIEQASLSDNWKRVEKLAADARQVGVVSKEIADYSRRARAVLAPAAETTGPLGVELVLLHGGTFQMGASGGASDELPVHEVKLSSFYIARREVTRAQMDASIQKLKVLPPGGAEGRMPAVSATWDEAVAFCSHISAIDPKGATYRLPTEAEWEFAARGSAGTMYPWGNDAPDSLKANLLGKADGYVGLAPVGRFPKGATKKGIQDLIGNAAEWCLDWYGPYGAKLALDPTGPPKGKERVVRGSAYAYPARMWSRSAARGVAFPGERKDTIGFRVVREVTPEERGYLEMVNADADEE
jgi:serine/threonine-protein kinase